MLKAAKCGNYQWTDVNRRFIPEIIKHKAYYRSHWQLGRREAHPLRGNEMKKLLKCEYDHDYYYNYNHGQSGNSANLGKMINF
jgi:hypothetical protein